MPQINQLLLVYQSQWFWLLLVLAMIYFAIGKGMVPKIEATIDKRDRKIADDLSAAERARAAAHAVETSLSEANAAARTDAQTVAAAAKAQGVKDAEKRLAAAEGEIAAKMAAAEQALAKARSKALANLDVVASEAAQDIVAKLSGAKITAVEVAAAVKVALAHG